MLALPLLAPAAAAAAPPSSPSFVLQQSTLNTGGAAVAGPSYAVNSSLGQESVIGTSSSIHHVVQSGFWSWVGSGLVPVVLMVSKNALDPTTYDLDWSGNNPPYQVYRSTDCTNVFGNGVLVTNPTKEWTDTAAPPDQLVCYNVLATAPGPFAPPATPEPTAAADPSPEGASLQTRPQPVSSR